MSSDKKILTYELENVGQGYYLHKLLHLSYYMIDFYQFSIELMGMWSATEMSYQLTLKM